MLVTILAGNRETTKSLEGDPCSGHFVPDTMVYSCLHLCMLFTFCQGETYTAYISKSGALDYGIWLRVAKCLKLWDLDARGFHKVRHTFQVIAIALFCRACGGFGSIATTSL